MENGYTLQRFFKGHITRNNRHLVLCSKGPSGRMESWQDSLAVLPSMPIKFYYTLWHVGQQLLPRACDHHVVNSITYPLDMTRIDPLGQQLSWMTSGYSAALWILQKCLQDQESFPKLKAQFFYSTVIWKWSCVDESPYSSTTDQYNTKWQFLDESTSTLYLTKKLVLSGNMTRWDFLTLRHLRFLIEHHNHGQWHCMHR